MARFCIALFCALAVGAILPTAASAHTVQPGPRLSRVLIPASDTHAKHHRLAVTRARQRAAKERREERVAEASQAREVAVQPQQPALPASTSGPSVEEWEAVARCESTDHWNDNTGNGFYGGLQFTASTWDSFGGTAYAPRADEASPSEQMAVADKVLAAQGWGAWPVCQAYR